MNQRDFLLSPGENIRAQANVVLNCSDSQGLADAVSSIEPIFAPKLLIERVLLADGVYSRSIVHTESP